MSSRKGFFSIENNRKVLAAFLFNTATLRLEDARDDKLLSFSKTIIEFIREEPETWDDACQFNIEHIGSHFISELINFQSSPKDRIGDIFTDCYRLLCEYDFFLGQDRELNRDLREILNQIQHNADSIDPRIRPQIFYASYLMPAQIAKKMMNTAEIGALVNFSHKVDEAAILREEWEKDLIKKKDEVEILKSKLEEYRYGFNFVGLHKGFQELFVAKKRESKILLLGLLATAAIAIAPVLYEAWRLAQQPATSMSHMVSLLPIFTLEVILIYFFKVLLAGHRSTKAQIIQIQLRQTLCQFVQSYVEYAAKIKKQDGKILEKFESLIFSGLVSDPEKIPSTFDGLDQLASLVKSIKG